jgi:hypothetical protein
MEIIGNNTPLLEEEIVDILRANNYDTDRTVDATELAIPPEIIQTFQEL